MPSFGSRTFIARLGCLTTLLAAAACSDSSGPSSPPVLEANTAISQTANAGSVVASPVVRVGREDGSPIKGAIVKFSVSGGGTISVTADTTDAAGLASAGTWRLGNTPGTSTVTATSTSVPGATVTFTATGELGPAASVVKTGGDGQFRRPGEMVSPPPSVVVRDAAGNPVPGVTVTFAVTAGGGSATGVVQTTDANGVATVGSWTVGIEPGQNRLTATVAGLPVVTFTATVVAPALVSIHEGNNQIAAPGQAVPIRPSVLVRDNLGQPVEGVIVTFSVTSGGGTVTGATAVTNAQGIATVGSWVLGDPGDNTLVATVSGLPSVTFTAVATRFNIELRYRSTLTARQRLAFERAVFKWSRVISGDLADIPLTQSATGCYPALNETIDDLVIFVDLSAIDGPGKVLGSAGPCLVRSSTGLSIVGQMKFDNADIANMETNNTLDDVILHEMGHVLGIGTLWKDFFPGLVAGLGTSDPYFTGANARAAFAAAGGSVYTGNPVPLENTGGEGTRDGHWRETVLGNELMTGFISTAGNPLSAITIGALLDMGYVVNLAAADPYTVPGALAILGVPMDGFHLEEVLLTRPQVVGPDGNIVSGRSGR